VTRLARAAAPTGIARVPSLLSLVADVAAHLARAPRVGDALPWALQQVRDALDAIDCTLWRPNGVGLPAVWRANDDAAELRNPVLDLEGDGASVIAVTVRYGDRDLGVLSVRLGRAISPDERTSMRAVADLLAPLLAAEANQEPAAEP
jgi:hypothetical protein